MKIQEVSGDGPSLFFPIPKSGVLLDSQMDYLGNVWMTLKDGDSQSLILWRLSNLSFETLIPFTKDKRIELGRTLAFSGITNQYVIIGGAAGETKFTTRSVEKSR
jgi:hypothetical protein